LSIRASPSRQRLFEKTFKALAKKYPTPDRVQGFIRKLNYNKNKTMLSALDAAEDLTLKCRIADVVGELGGYILESSEWPEVLPFAYTQIIV
jgi:hypothetical protein